MGRPKTSDKTTSARQYEELAVTLAKRGVDITPGSLAYLQSSPDGFMVNGWFYEVDSELIYLGRNFEEAFEVAVTSAKSWGGVVGMSGDKNTKSMAHTAVVNEKMTRGQKIGQACAILFTGATLGTGIGALEEAGYSKSAFGAKAGIGLLGILAQASKSPAIRTTGLLALGGLTYDIAKNNLAPIAAVVLPNSKQEQIESKPLQTLDEARDQKLELVVTKQEQEVTSRPSVVGADSSSETEASQTPELKEEKVSKVSSRASKVRVRDNK